MQELRQMLAEPCNVEKSDGSMSETAVSQRVRLAAPACFEAILWRNNVGQLLDDRGVPVRYGLANDSKKVNEQVKSSDLIGLTPITFGGWTFGVFTAIETKREGWTYKGTDHEQAQLRYHNIVRSLGGIAGFAASPQDYQNLVNSYGQTI
jgi:hypothetical protein